MPADHFEFDESGDTFLCFLTAFYTLILIPVTYFCWPSFDFKDTYEQGKRKCMCQPCQVKRHYLKSSTPFRRLKKILIKGAFVFAWGVFFLLVYKLTLIEPTVEFNPFDLLEIERDASIKEIRSAYKKLSLKYHPDKGGDTKRFILISKAYTALTNEESRKNWEEYGNPDGPGAAHFGIALPKWMIEKENFNLVIGAYILLFMLILPISVGTWWYNTMKFSKTNVLLDTIRYFCGAFIRSPYMAMPRVIKVLTNAYEFNPNFNKEIARRPSDNTELPPLIMQIPIFTIFKKAIVGSPCSVKARALIYAHLERLYLPPKTLHIDRQYIIKHSPRLIDEMINSLSYVLAAAMNENGARNKPLQHLATIENCMHLVPMLVQALSDNASPLLQLPHITQTQLRHMATKQRNIKSIRQLISLPEDKRRSLLRSLSDEQYRDLLIVCASMPSLEISYRCEVLDDEDPSIWPFSLVTVTVLIKRQPLFDLNSVNNLITTENNTNILKDSCYYYDGSHCNSMNNQNISNTTNTTTNTANDHDQNEQDHHYYYNNNTNQDNHDYWSIYTNHSNNSTTKLYPIVINTDKKLINFENYDPNEKTSESNKLNQPKKSTIPIWDKNKRKKPGRKNKFRRQDNAKHHNQQSQQQTNQCETEKLSDSRDVNENYSEPEDKLLNLDNDDDNNNNNNNDDDDDSHQHVQNQNLDTNSINHLLSCDNLKPTLTSTSIINDQNQNRLNKLDSDKSVQDRNKLCGKLSKKKSESGSHCTHVVHCPFFPVEKFEGWWVYMVDRKTRQLITKPNYLATLQTEEELQLRFVAPAVPGQYLYILSIRSDSYLDCDFSESIRFTVRPLPERIVQILKVQEEAGSESSDASCESSAETGDEDEQEEEHGEEDEAQINLPDIESETNLKTSIHSVDGGEEDDDEDYDEYNENENKSSKRLNSNHVSAYLSNM